MLAYENYYWRTKPRKEQNETDPTFFKRLAAQQAPEFYGSVAATAALPADKITGTEPGEIFRSQEYRQSLW